ncbi:MAG: molybdopterin-dependent oxidoreductase [Isosphaeraceae bacterium]
MDPAFDAADADALRPAVKYLVVQDTWPTELASRADAVLAGATFAEKAGCYVNADGRLQYSKAALPPRDGSLPDLDILAILSQRPGGGPVSSRDVLKELAAEVPAFSGASAGQLPEFGLALAPAKEPEGFEPSAYEEPWLLARKSRGERFYAESPAKS